MKVNKQVAEKLFLQGREVEVCEADGHRISWSTSQFPNLPLLLSMYYSNCDINELTFHVQGSSNTSNIAPQL